MPRKPNSIQLVTKNLKRIRKDQKVTQKTIGTAIFEGVNAEHGFRRIERTGKTSRETAEKITEYLGVSLASLTGTEYPRPEDSLRRVEKWVKRHLDDKDNTWLTHRYEELCKGGAPRTTVATIAGRDEALQILAQEICQDIAAAWWDFSPEKIEKLATDTGIPKEELLLLANFRERWLMVVLDPSRIMSLMEVVDSASAVAEYIREYPFVKRILTSDDQKGLSVPPHMKEDPFIKRILTWDEPSDAPIRIWRDDPWICIEITNPRLEYYHTIQFKFTRCCPHNDNKGIHFVQATWLDEYFIEDAFTKLACDNFNSVTNFEGCQFPSDIKNLRFLVIETECGRNNKERYRKMMIVPGRFFDKAWSCPR